jgi:hypothetical protein
LSKGDKTAKLNVVPVMEGAEFDKAMAKFKDAQASYQEKIKQEQANANVRAKANKYLASFQAKRTGFHNIDYIIHQAASLEAFSPEFASNGKGLKMKKLYLISFFDGAKSVVTYTSENSSEFFYLEGFNNSILLETNDGTFYSINSKNFKGKKFSKSSPKLDLQKVDYPLNSLVQYEDYMNKLNEGSM